MPLRTGPLLTSVELHAWVCAPARSLQIRQSPGVGNPCSTELAKEKNVNDLRSGTITLFPFLPVLALALSHKFILMLLLLKQQVNVKLSVCLDLNGSNSQANTITYE